MWGKESLSEALADHPEMAGRLRRRADGSWEVKLNDTGVRLLQATVDATLDEFLAGKGALARREAALAPWTDVNADDPDMCPPFFMQVSAHMHASKTTNPSHHPNKHEYNSLIMHPSCDRDPWRGGKQS